MNNYNDFLKTKEIIDKASGFNIDEKLLNPMLYHFQKDIVKWALIRGRAAIFADCGLGKTPIQLEWSKHIHNKINKPILIFAPLAVSEQTKREGVKFGIDVNICEDQRDIINGINITNYEKLHKFENKNLGALVIDESSILKGYDGKFRKDITEFAKNIPYRLACTATPSPNDIVEIINHTEFLGIMRDMEIKALFFSNDGSSVHNWKLKKYAEKDFWKWLSSWAVCLRMPSDLGYEDGKFVLPELDIIQVKIKLPTDIIKKYTHLPLPIRPNLVKGLKNEQKIRKDSIKDKVIEAAELVNNSKEQWLVWCNLNEESKQLTLALNDAVEVAGSTPNEKKKKAMLDFQNGKLRVLVTKPSIAGFGMNWQNCFNMIFVGLDNSFEKLYQATRRCWRFGQEKEVNSYHIVTELDGNIVENIGRKEREFVELYNNLIKNINLGGQLGVRRQEMEYKEAIKEGKDWKIYLGDSIKTIDNIKSESVGLSIFSPPFPGMYVYTNSKHDIGNTKDIQELIEHFRFLMGKDKLYRVLMPGRHCCIHLTQGVAFKGKDGYIGIKDFRGKVIQMMEDEGWIYYGEVCIDKCPQIQAIRTKDRGLLFKTLSKDASHLHPGGADYLLQFRKPGDSPVPIQAGISKKYNTKGWITSDEWIEWAAPVWYKKTKYYPGGISATDVLKYRDAKEDKDERHLCPLQLGVIERAVKLWSNPEEIIYSPFAGIGSEGYVALKFNRRFVGGELKESYFNLAVKNLQVFDKMSKWEKK